MIEKFNIVDAADAEHPPPENLFEDSNAEQDYIQTDENNNLEELEDNSNIQVIGEEENSIVLAGDEDLDDQKLK